MDISECKLSLPFQISGLIWRTAGIAYTLAPFLGPTIGPIICGFLGQTAGWKWVAGLIAMFSGICWLFGLFIVPETYAPTLLKQRAAKLTQLTGKVYKSKLEIETAHQTARDIFKVAMVRPWVLMRKEPIALLLSLYMAISKSVPFEIELRLAIY